MSAMIVSKEETRHVARLARLALSEDELRQYGHQLSEILSYARSLDEIDTSQVEPAPYPFHMELPLREDERAGTLLVEVVLAMAPDREGESFRVPCVLGAGGWVRTR